MINALHFDVNTSIRKGNKDIFGNEIMEGNEKCKVTKM
jgi:hypothetical protein